MSRLALFPVLAATSLYSPTAAAQDAAGQDWQSPILTAQQQIEPLQAQETNVEQAALAQSTDQQSAGATPSEATPAQATNTQWRGAPRFTAPGGWSFKPRGRIVMDAGWVNAPAGAGADDGFGSALRRLRLGAEGSMPGGFGYAVELDFTKSQPEVMGAFISYNSGGLRILAGHHNNFQSLEELTSSLNTSFIERAAFTDAFGFGRRLGVSAAYTRGIVLVQAGAFTTNVSNPTDVDWSVDGRLVLTPVSGATHVHLGGSLRRAELARGSTLQYRQRPFFNFTSDRFISTGAFSASSETGYGLETAILRGPFHISGEAFWQSVDRPETSADPIFFGSAIEAGLFLTAGDKRTISSGFFQRTKPQSPVGAGGIGSVQINVRYDFLDLVDAGITGGKQDGYMASLIWKPMELVWLILNYARLDYQFAARPLPDGSRAYSVDSVGMRAQIEF